MLEWKQTTISHPSHAHRVCHANIYKVKQNRTMFRWKQPCIFLIEKNTAIKLRTKSVGAVAENDTPLLGIIITVLLRS